MGFKVSVTFLINTAARVSCFCGVFFTFHNNSAKIALLLTKNETITVTRICRKYLSIVALILVSLFLLDASVYTHEDLCIIEQTMSDAEIEAEDCDLDEDSDFTCLDADGVSCLPKSISLFFSIGKTQSENKCSAALRLGQVRRYAPRNNMADSHNYIILKSIKDGADFGSRHLFLCNSIFIHSHYSLTKSFKQ